MLSQALAAALEGANVGVYRERDELLPIIARSPDAERVDFSNLAAVQVWSPAAQAMIPVGQVVTSFETEFEDPQVWRRNRAKMLRIHADPREGLPSELLARVKPRIEQALGWTWSRSSVGRSPPRTGTRRPCRWPTTTCCP